MSKPLMFVTILFAVLLTGLFESENKASESLTYCENVESKVWPDYDRKYDELCTDENIKYFKKVLQK